MRTINPRNLQLFRDGRQVVATFNAKNNSPLSPGDVFRFQGEAWRVIANRTPGAVLQTIEVERVAAVG